MNNAEIVCRVCQRIPYPDQMTELNASREGEFRFTWRDIRFRVDDDLNVECVQGAGIYGCNESILLEALLKRP